MTSDTSFWFARHGFGDRCRGSVDAARCTEPDEVALERPRRVRVAQGRREVRDAASVAIAGTSVIAVAPPLEDRVAAPRAPPRPNTATGSRILPGQGLIVDEVVDATLRGLVARYVVPRAGPDALDSGA